MFAITVVKDLESLSSISSIKFLEENEIWLFSERNKKIIKKFDEEVTCLIYLSGLSYGYFYGCFKFKPEFERCKPLKSEYNKTLNKVNATIFIEYKKKIYLKEIKNELEFVKNKRNWGSSLISGFRFISNEDFTYIQNQLK